MALEEEGERRQGERQRIWERHFQSILLAIVIGLMFWVGNSILELTKSFGAISVHLAQIDERVANLQSQVIATYRSSDAQRDVAETTHQIDALQKRVTAIEASINGRKTVPELQAWSKK